MAMATAPCGGPDLAERFERTMLPVKKTSKCRTRTRRAHHALRAPNLVACPKCRVAKLPHAYCHNCGYASSQVLIEPKTKES